MTYEKAVVHLKFKGPSWPWSYGS